MKLQSEPAVHGAREARPAVRASSIGRSSRHGVRYATRFAGENSCGTLVHVVFQHALPFTQPLTFASGTQELTGGLSCGCVDTHHEQPLSALHDFSSECLPLHASAGVSLQP